MCYTKFVSEFIKEKKTIYIKKEEVKWQIKRQSIK